MLLESYDLNEIILSKNYEDVKENLKEEIIKDLASKKLKFSNTQEPAEQDFLKNQDLNVVIDGEDYTMSYGNFLTFLIVTRPFNHFNVKMTEEYLFDPSDLSSYKDYYTKLLEKFKYSDKIKELIKDVVGELSIYSADINVTYGNTVSAKLLIDLAKKNKEFRDLLNYNLPNKPLEFNEIEEIINKNLKKIMEILSTTDNVLNPFIKSGAGINSKQLGQVVSLIGSKPDLFGKIIPYPINTSFLRGLDVKSYYINALGARKSLITNFKQVRNSGYLTRKLSLLLLDTKLNDVEDCGSHPNNYIKINIESKKVLNRFKKRFYFDESDNTLKKIDTNDENLIGQVLSIPSPISCASNEGVCRKCYGDLFDINNDLNIGMIAVLILTDPLTQRLLSSKHLLETRSSKIEWGQEFEKFITVNRNLLFSKLTNKPTLIIKEDDITEEEENDEINFDRFAFKTKGSITELFSPLNLTLSRELKVIMHDNYNIEEKQYELPLSVLDEKDAFATFIMDNNELSEPLLKIKNLIETNVFIKDNNINTTTNYFISLLNDSGINIKAVHVELILREMLSLHSKNREEFKEEVFPDYEMFRITDAILKGDSVSRALLFEQVKKLLTTLDYDTFDKDGDSILDSLL
ncbi:DNA-directed RNA polymerase beta' subunit [Bacillus phage vB_BpuM-BpSp]|nr:DNA-directed RNA polymerase beta' subunit [Bacillus phage vB_BpuM-BpSp]